MFNISELTCRVCLKEQNIMINIYDELEELQTNLSNLLEICGDLHVSYTKYVHAIVNLILKSFADR